MTDTTDNAPDWEGFARDLIPELIAAHKAALTDLHGPITPITDADQANIIAHLSPELEPTGPLPNRDSVMMALVKSQNAHKAALARVQELEGALRGAEQDFYTIANRFQDEDYIGPVAGLTVDVVCHAKPYYDNHMKFIDEAACRARAAITKKDEANGHS